MKINKQNAMRLWRERYGDNNDVCDYAGRPMFFLHYNDRESKYGWNIDHILPQDRNGVFVIKLIDLLKYLFAVHNMYFLF